SGVGAGDLDLGLVGLHRAQRLVEVDVIAHRDAPTRDRRVLQTLPQIGHQEIAYLSRTRHGRSMVRSMQSSSRSGPGSQSFSNRAGGYGVSNPVARNTGASSS